MLFWRKPISNWHSSLKLCARPKGRRDVYADLPGINGPGLHAEECSHELKAHTRTHQAKICRCRSKYLSDVGDSFTQWDMFPWSRWPQYCCVPIIQHCKWQPWIRSRQIRYSCKIQILIPRIKAQGRISEQLVVNPAGTQTRPTYMLKSWYFCMIGACDPKSIISCLWNLVHVSKEVSWLNQWFADKD